jgi:hypothetical protein
MIGIKIVGNYSIEETKGVFSWWNQVECNGTVPHLELILVFG